MIDQLQVLDFIAAIVSVQYEIRYCCCFEQYETQTKQNKNEIKKQV